MVNWETVVSEKARLKVFEVGFFLPKRRSERFQLEKG